MRVGLLTTSFPRHDDDTAGNFVLGFARALRDRGHRIDVMAPEPDRGTPPSWPGIDVHWVPYMRPRSLSRTFYRNGVPDNLRTDPLAWAGLLPFMANLSRAARRLDHCDALVSHWMLPSALVAGHVRHGRPHLAVCHSADLHLLRRLPGRERIARQLLAGSTALSFVSEDARGQFLGWLPPGDEGRCHVMPMGTDAVEPRRSEVRRRVNDELSVLCLGRLVPVKGFAEALEQLAGIDGVRVQVAGNGPEHDRIAAAGPHVRMLGEVTGEAKRRLLDDTDVLLAPSRVLASGRTEGVPTAILEAMQHGLPVIATAVGGIPSVVDHGSTGLLVTSHDVRDAVSRLRDEPGLHQRLAAGALRRAGEHTWPSMAPRVEQLLFG